MGQRLYYMDFCRALLMLLGIPYRAGQVFGPDPWLVNPVTTSLLLGHVNDVIHAFRMPAFFLLAGFFSVMVIRKAGLAAWLKARLARLGLPDIAEQNLNLYLAAVLEATLLPPPAPEPPPPAPATVTSVELGNAVDEENRVVTPASEFATTDTLYASVGTDGGSAARLTARWTYGEAGQLVRSTDADVPAGPQVVAFDIQHPEGWPTGNYTLEVQLDGTTVETRTFAVK